jgi:hypothetical protein
LVSARFFFHPDHRVGSKIISNTMSCCGKKTEAWRASLPTPDNSPAPAVAEVAAPRMFEYTGHKKLSVWGVVTGTRYFFDGPGSRVAVQAADAAAMGAVPALRRVRE